MYNVEFSYDQTLGEYTRSGNIVGKRNNFQQRSNTLIPRAIKHLTGLYWGIRGGY